MIQNFQTRYSNCRASCALFFLTQQSNLLWLARLNTSLTMGEEEIMDLDSVTSEEIHCTRRTILRIVRMRDDEQHF